MLIGVIRSARFCLFRAYTYPQRCSQDCSEHCEIARITAEGRNLAVNPQTNQVKNNQAKNDECGNEKWPLQLIGKPLGKNALGRYGLVRFERSFVNDLAALIFDPSRVALNP